MRCSDEDLIDVVDVWLRRALRDSYISLLNVDL